MKSVLSQREVPDEIIVVVDGSEDGTEEALFKLEPSLIILSQPHRGVSAARNTGIHHAKGEWIAFLDDDDLWHEDKLLYQKSWIAQGSPWIIHTDEVWFYRGKRVPQRWHHRKGGGDQFFRSLQLCCISPSAAVVHRKVFEKIGFFDERMPACEDYDFWLRATLHFPVGFVPLPLTLKRGGLAPQLSRQPLLDQWRVYALWKLLKQPLSKVERAMVCQTIQWRCRILSQGAEKRGRHKESQAWLTFSREPTHHPFPLWEF